MRRPTAEVNSPNGNGNGNGNVIASDNYSVPNRAGGLTEIEEAWLVRALWTA